MLGQIRGTDGEVVRRTPSATQVLDQRQKMVEGTLVIDLVRSLDAVRHAFAQTLKTPLCEGDGDYRDLEDASLRHRIECGEDHLVGELACYTEKHQRVRVRRAIRCLPSWRSLLRGFRIRRCHHGRSFGESLQRDHHFDVRVV